MEYFALVYVLIDLWYLSILRYFNDRLTRYDKKEREVVD